jgi:hypothetical protein
MAHTVWYHTITRWTATACCAYSVEEAVVEESGDLFWISNITRCHTELPCLLTVDPVYLYMHTAHTYHVPSQPQTLTTIEEEKERLTFVHNRSTMQLFTGTQFTSPGRLR